VSIHYDDTQSSFEPAGAAATSGPSSATAEEFARFLRQAERLPGHGEAAGSLREWLDLAEAWRIAQALRDCKGNRSAAARKLGIGRRTLYAKMDKLRITPSWSF
jgi:DNA-binding NtrC family response regulator